MNRDEVCTELQEVFRDLFLDESIVLHDELTARDILHWNSFNHINLLLATEQRFGIRFKTGEVESLHNVGQLISLIESRLNGAC